MDVLKEMILNNIKSVNDCWEWQLGLNGQGYGCFMLDRQKYLTHRLSYSLFVNTIPQGLQVLHSCDNRKCCNPAHLRSGTNYDNVQDRQSRNRQAKGVTHGRHKLTEEDINEIKQLHQSGNYTHQALSQIFNISRSHISNILNNKYWKHVT